MKLLTSVPAFSNCLLLLTFRSLVKEREEERKQRNVSFSRKRKIGPIDVN